MSGGNIAWEGCLSQANAFYVEEAPWLPDIWRQLGGVSGERFLSTDGRLGAVLYSQRLDVDLDLRATWGPSVTWKAIPIIAGPPTAQAISELVQRLESFRTDVAASAPCEPGLGCALSISWPAFVNVAAAMRKCHFSPMTTLASFAALPLTVAEDADNVARGDISPMSEAEVDFVVDSWLELVHEEADYGAVWPRRSTRGLIVQRVLEWLSDPSVFVRVARVDGIPVGFVAAHMLEPNDQVYRRVRVGSSWYADAAIVTQGYRRSGIGHDLAMSVRQKVVSSGRSDLLLHYSEGSPISGPFWRSLGAQPRWISWWREAADGR